MANYNAIKYDGFSKGSTTLIKTLTASSSSTLSFVDGSSDVVLDSTYPIYKFVYTSMHPATNGVYFTVGFRDGSTNYDATKTTTYFRAYHDEADSATALEYTAGSDLAQGTGFQYLSDVLGNDNDQSCSGYLHLFNPSSTTFVKHFIANLDTYHQSDYSVNSYVAGYCNVTAAIDAVQFKMSSGNIDAGTIQLIGIT